MDYVNVWIMDTASSQVEVFSICLFSPQTDGEHKQIKKPLDLWKFCIFFFIDISSCIWANIYRFFGLKIRKLPIKLLFWKNIYNIGGKLKCFRSACSPHKQMVNTSRLKNHLTCEDVIQWILVWTINFTFMVKKLNEL
jgi:hypothetical protein